YLRKLAEERGRDPDGIKIAARVGHKILAEPNPDCPRMLIGTADQVVDQIKRYQEAGVSHFVIDLFYRAPEIQNATIDDVITAIERLATEIRPRVQSAAV